MGVLLAGGPFNWLPENISTYGGKIDHLFWLITAICGVTFVATQALLVYSLIKFRAKKGEKAQFTHGSHKLEISWTLVTGAILFFLALYQYDTWAQVKIDFPDPSKEDVLEVQVLAKQFEWNFRYHSPKGEFSDGESPFRIGELHVPVGKKVLLYMRSVDVLHSLFLPHLRFKQDLVPGLTIKGWFEATKTTEQARAERLEAAGDDEAARAMAEKFDFEIACAELCGILHHEMKGKVVVHSEEGFQKFLRDRLEEIEGGAEAPIWKQWDEAAWTENKRYQKQGSEIHE